jgi:hypothetical protein
MDDLFHQEGFLVPFPIWLIGDITGKLRGLLKSQNPNDNSLAVVVFTDQDLAQTALDSSPQPSAHRLISIPTTLAFIGLLFILEKQGIPHVIFDPTEKKVETRLVTELLDEFVRGIE